MAIVARLCAAPLLCAALALASPAAAEEAAPAPAFSVTVSPAHLWFGALEAMGEVALGRRFSAALVAGWGPRAIDATNGMTSHWVAATELGAQVRWYPIGDFTGGLQLGAEVLQLWTAGDDESHLLLDRKGLTVAAFTGVKWVWWPAVTLDVQLGVNLLQAGAGWHGPDWFWRAGGSGGAACAGSGGCAASSGNAFPLLLNGNLGWSW